MATAFSAFWKAVLRFFTKLFRSRRRGHKMQAESRANIVAEVNRQFVLTKCEYFVDVQLWPLRQALDPNRWLENFQEDEIEHAIHLLNAFMFFREPIVSHLFVAAFQSLSRHVRRPGEAFVSTKVAWNRFLDSLLITHATGEHPSPTDSGYLFDRKARQVLGIPEERILSPEDVLSELIRSGPRPVVFVDDFVGSGQQFITTWHRSYTLPAGPTTSFAHISSVLRGASFYHCPLLCTELGLVNIQRACPSVFVSAAHVLPPRYSAVARDSVIWPDRLLSSGPDFVRRASARAGIPDHEREGFHKLGLCIAFEHCIPDATLPLFYWEQNGWKPLFPRK